MVGSSGKHAYFQHSRLDIDVNENGFWKAEGEGSVKALKITGITDSKEVHDISFLEELVM